MFGEMLKNAIADADFSDDEAGGDSPKKEKRQSPAKVSGVDLYFRSPKNHDVFAAQRGEFQATGGIRVAQSAPPSSASLVTECNVASFV
jgi:hypothetical protein